MTFLRTRKGSFAEPSCHPFVTDPEKSDAQKLGLASALTLRVAQQIRARAEAAFLHVIEENLGARRLYEKLGFVLRCAATAVVVQFDE